jgi:hypothetical protein
MATHTETTFTYTCDLCGEQQDKDDLRQLHGEPVPRGVGAADKTPQADICPDCASRPVSDVLAFLDQAAEEAKQPRLIRVRRTG